MTVFVWMEKVGRIRCFDSLACLSDKLVIDYLNIRVNSDTVSQLAELYKSFRLCHSLNFMIMEVHEGFGCLHTDDDASKDSSCYAEPDRKETMYMMKVLRHCGIVPKEIKICMEEEMNSFGAIWSTMKETDFSLYVPDAVSERTADKLCRIACVMHRDLRVGDLCQPSFSLLWEKKHSLERLVALLEVKSPMNLSLLGFYHEIDMSARDAYMLHLLYDIHDYESLMTYARVATPPLFDGASEYAMAQLPSIVATFLFPESLSLMDDPLEEFVFDDFLFVRFQRLLKHESVGLSEEQMDVVKRTIAHPVYSVVVKYRNDFVLGSGSLKDIPEEKRRLVVKAIDFTERDMQSVHPCMRFEEYGSLPSEGFAVKVFKKASKRDGEICTATSMRGFNIGVEKDDNSNDAKFDSEDGSVTSIRDGGLPLTQASFDTESAKEDSTGDEMVSNDGENTIGTA